MGVQHQREPRKAHAGQYGAELRPSKPQIESTSHPIPRSQQRDKGHHPPQTRIAGGLWHLSSSGGWMNQTLPQPTPVPFWKGVADRAEITILMRGSTFREVWMTGHFPSIYMNSFNSPNNFWGIFIILHFILTSHLWKLRHREGESLA